MLPQLVAEQETLQVTAVLLLPVTVAVNVAGEPPAVTVVLLGETVMATVPVDGWVFDEVELWLEPQALRNPSSKEMKTTLNVRDVMLRSSMN